MLKKILLANVAIILLFSSVQATDYRLERYCSLVPLGTKLSNLDDCHQFYTCVSANMVNAGKCPNNQVFNKDSQGCITTPNGSCASLTNICENQNKKWVADPNVCGNWYYCEDGKIVGSGHCKGGQYLDYDAQTCKNGPCSVADNSGGVSNMCSIMQNGQFFGDFDDCRKWHKCYGLQMKTGECKNTIYDSASRQCVQSNGNTCGGPTTTCTVNGNSTADSTVCSHYFVCNSNLVWTKQSCPLGQYYDVPSKTCKSRQLATTVSTCDRCEYSTSAWVNAVDPLCEKYLFCSNGVKTGESQCQKGFFDEELQRCSAGGNLTTYRETNGACAAPPSPQPPGSETPGTGTPGTGTPGTGTPGSETPGTETPGTGTPGSETPGTGTPGSETPGTGTPGTGTPGTGTPGSETPGTGTPGSGTPGTGTPGSETPGTGTPGSETPGTGTPGSGTPGTGTPGSETPGTGTPGSETPGTGTPGSETPGTGTPGSETPGTGTPGSETPGTGTPGSETPGTGTPGSETPGTGTPGSETPGTGTPGSETPGTGTPGSETDKKSYVPQPN